MSPFLLLGLLSLSLFAVTLDSSADEVAEEDGDFTDVETETDTGTNDDTDDTGDDADDPDVDDSDGDDDDDDDDSELNGTAEADTLSAALSQTVNGLAGDDVITADETASGATLNGDEGNDSITPQGPNSTVNGGNGDDTITATTAPDGTLNGDAGDDTFNLDGPGLEANGGAGNDILTSLVDSQDMVLNGGEGDDTISAAGLGGTIDGGEGDDLISVEGAIGSVNGGDGDDLIVSTDGENGGGASLNGGAGDDVIRLLGSASGATHVAVTADGGFNDDTFDIQTALYLDTEGTVTDVFTGGDGADTFDLSFYIASGTETADGGGGGIVTRVTDFVMGEDLLTIDEEIRDLEGETLGFTLEDDITFDRPDGEDFTDVILSYSNDDEETVTVTVRLEGVDSTFGEDQIEIA